MPSGTGGIIEKLLNLPIRLETHALTVTVGRVLVCQQLNLALTTGQCWGLLGGNGVGKTTLLHTLAGLRVPYAGTVWLEGQPLDKQNRRTIGQRLALLPQEAGDAFPATVLETALVGRYPYLGPWRWEGAADYQRAQEALIQVGLGDLADRPVATLSGGERARLRLATFLVQDTPVGLLDEPTNHLDVGHQVRLLTLLRERNQIQGGTLLMALHEVNLAARYCDHCLLLYGDGAVEMGPTAQVLTVPNLERLYHHPVTAIAAPWGQGWLPT